MTDSQARTAANVMMGAAALAAAFYVLRHPPVRRAVWRAARELSGPGAMWAVAGLLRAWEQSGTVPGTHL